MAQLKWKCSYCGASAYSAANNRPPPGYCARKGKTKDGKFKPYTWKKVGKM